MEADVQVLRARLIDVLALEPQAPALTKDSARDAIKAACLAPCVCARIPRVGGRIHTFGQYFAALYGETLDGKPVPIQRAKDRVA